MRIDRTSKTRLGLSVLASGSLLLAAVGAASAHVGPGSHTVLFGGDLRSRILAMEPDLDEQEVDDLVDSVQEAIDEAAAEDDQGDQNDQGDQAETHDGDHADGPGLGAHEREKAVEAKPEASHKHHSADESKSDGSDAKDDENENEDGDAEDGEHDGGDQADGQDGPDGGDAGGDAGGGHESSGD